MNHPIKIVIMIFDGVELLDFSGPFEVFTVANREVSPAPFEVTTIAPSESIVAQGGLRIQSDHLMEDSPKPDVLLIPGGAGVNELLENHDVLECIRSLAAASQWVTSVCTGSVLLGRCGLLDGIPATTHHRCLGQLKEIAPEARIIKGRRYVESGHIITAGGISAGIDMSLHLVARWVGEAQAHAVAHRMEYHWADPDASTSPHQNDLGQAIGFPLPDWETRPWPTRSPMSGQYCSLEPLDPDAHTIHLWQAFAEDQDGRNWTYLPYGPFESQEAMSHWIHQTCTQDDPHFYTILDGTSRTPVGMVSYLRIQPQVGVIEVGHIHYATRLQHTTAATEAMYLMMRHVFDELGYRRYEWKCDALNERSRRAASRLGFTFEGIFRQANVYKGRSRNTAWFSITDREWPSLKRAYEQWLHPANHDAAGRQRRDLQYMILKERASNSIESDGPSEG